MSTVVDIVSEARKNNYYRKVVYTGERSQLVVMALRPKEAIGTETHKFVEQTIVIVDGFGTVFLNGQREQVRPGDSIVVTPGTRHNLIAGPIPLKLFTVYSPPNHLPGRVHRTRAEAEIDVQDQKFGAEVR